MKKHEMRSQAPQKIIKIYIQLGTRNKDEF